VVTVVARIDGADCTVVVVDTVEDAVMGGCIDCADCDCRGCSGGGGGVDCADCSRGKSEIGN